MKKFLNWIFGQAPLWIPTFTLASFMMVIFLWISIFAYTGSFLILVTPFVIGGYFVWQEYKLYQSEE